MIRRLAGRIFLALVAVFAFGGTMPVHAATGLSVGPFLQQVDLTKGQAQSDFEITLGNNTPYTLPMLVSIVDFGAADDNGGVNFLPKVDDLSHKYGLASWMHTEKNNLIMAPHSSQQIKVIVDNKTSMSPGGHYGAVIFQLDKSQLQPGQSDVNFLKAVSTLVLAKKGDGGKAELTYSGMTWDGAPLGLPSSVHVKLYNTGNIHSVPSGDITLTNTLGQVVSIDRLNPDNTIILPESLRAYPITVSHDPLQLVPGWVSLTLRYRVNDTSPYQTVTNRIYIISPITILILLVLIIGAVVSFIFRKRLRECIRHITYYFKKTVQCVSKKMQKKSRYHKK